MQDALHDAFVTAIAGRGDGAFEIGVPGLVLFRRSEPIEMGRHTLYRPALCVVVQGAKRLMFGDSQLDYAAGQALVIGLDVPAMGRVMVANPDAPYLGLNMDLDPTILHAVLEELDHPPRPSEGGAGLFVASVDDGLADSVRRLIELSRRPEAIPVLHHAILREIAYWLLTGPHGAEFARLALPDGHARRIAAAIRLLREHYDRPVRMEDLADAARMSASAFYQHFKVLTGMTPLTYQKQLRLVEARRRMVTDGINAESAAFAVGYESPSQFSREYARMFGTPPKRDVMALRAVECAGEV